MITNLFLNVIAISISTSLIIICLLIFAPFLTKRYAIKWKYLMWTVLAVRLIIPFHIDIPFPQMVIDVPAEITVPIGTDHENDAPAMSPTGQNRIEADRGKAAAAPTQTARKPLKLTILDIAAYLWLTGCLLFLSVHIFSFLHYKGQIIKKGRAVKERYILQQVRKISGKLQIKPNIRILRYQGAESPMVIGSLKPMLVLPDCDYSEEELFFILKHELIHIKRHDIYGKLLFVTANAVHWFNPLIYMMQREAVVDMELSCDERVIRKASYAVRKAYTEALLSAFSKRHKKGTLLTTQFYGGKKIMKKRFKNILTRSPRKSGLFVCILTICVTAVLGMMIGCSAAKNDSPGEPIQTDQQTTNPGIDDTPDTQAENDSAQAGTADADGTEISNDAQNGNLEIPTELPSTADENDDEAAQIPPANEVKYMDIAHVFQPYDQAVEISLQLPEDWDYTIWDVEEESPDWGYSVKIKGRDDAVFHIRGQFGTMTADGYLNGPESFRTSQGMTGQYSWDEYVLDDKTPAIQGIAIFDTELAGFYGVSFNMPKSVYSENKNIIEKVFQSIVILSGDPAA